MYPEALEGLKRLKDGTSKGNDFLGWLNLPADITPELLADIEKRQPIYVRVPGLLWLLVSEVLIWEPGL